jgi:hypothetical protein
MKGFLVEKGKPGRYSRKATFWRFGKVEVGE